MAKTDIGPKIGIENEAQFRRELNAINQGMKTLDAEAKAVAASMQDEADAAKKSAAQKDVLERKISTQAEKLKMLEQGLEASAKKYGEADTRTQKWQKAVYDATGDLANMEHELKGLDGAVDETTGSMKEAGDAALGWADVMKGSICADAVKAGVKALAGFIRDAASALRDASSAGALYADTYNTMAATTGLSTDTLQEYAYMADLVDVSLETLTGAQTKMLNSMRKAKAGTGDAAEAWKAMDIHITNADGSLRDTEDVLNETLKALGKIENETERDAAAMSIFGKSAQELNPLIKAGADQLDAMRKEAHDTGYVLSGSALTALNRQQDAMDRLSKRAEAVSNAFAAKMAPSVAQGAEALIDAFDNPRVQRGIDVVSEGVASLTSGVMELAADALPTLFKVFDFGDERLRLYNDAQLEIVNRADKIAAAHDELVGEYKANAREILNETERTQNLWKELQTLAGESGNVKSADHDRAQLLLSELNQALGTEYKMNDNLILQYQEMQKEIDNLIKKQEAEALIQAGKEAFTQADVQKTQMLQAAADLVPQIENAGRALEIAGRDYVKAREYAERFADGTEEGETKRLRYLQSYEKAVSDAQKTFDSLNESYKQYNEQAATYYKEIDRWQKAQAAAAQGNYKEAVRLLTDEFGATLDYYRSKKKLNEQEKEDLRNKIESQERLIEQYKKNLEKGLTGFSEAGLKELEDYVADAKRILDGKDVGSAYLDGLESALRDKQRKARIREAAREVARTVDDAARRTLEIRSPSRKAKYVGQMWDQGLIAGMESQKAALKESASDLGRTMMEASWPGAQEIGNYYGGNYSVPIGKQGGAGATSAYTTNLGGINITIPGAGAVNEDVLAQRIAVRLTDELTRAQRGGRR